MRRHVPRRRALRIATDIVQVVSASIHKLFHERSYAIEVQQQSRKSHCIAYYIYNAANLFMIFLLFLALLSAAQQLNMTVCSNHTGVDCSGDCRVYVVPTGKCYSPAALFPNGTP